MEMTQKKKLCPNCEGNVSYDAIFCPYCRADLSRAAQKPEAQEGKSQASESLASLYRPPYLVRESHGYGVPDERESSYEEPQEEEYFEEEKKEPGNRSVWALLLLSVGGNLLTLGLLILFFSEAGRLTLEWKSGTWFLYCFLSAPFLFLGWKCLLLKPAPESTQEM